MSTRDNYWQTIAGERVSRRRMLAATGATAAAAAMLAACGGSTSDGSKDNSSLVVELKDTTKQAKRDGLLKDRTFTDAPSLSTSTGAGNFLNPVSGKTYNTLLRTKPGYMKPMDSSVIEGSLAESFEWAPDGSQVTVKLRQGVKWHNKPPVNGRGLEVDDILGTWERFAKVNTARSEVVNALNPNAPVLSLTATDSRTLVLKLKEPVIYVLNYFSKPNASGGLNIAPKETDTTFDGRSEMIGTGPFILTKYTPSVGFSFKRNPEYWDKDEALVDQIDLPIIPEYASALAQFKAGNIYSMGNNGSPQVSQDDILSVKRDEPRILIYEDDLKAFLEARIQSFGWLPDGKSPFMDERVRQAISMAYDRDLYLETFHNVKRLAAEGLEVQTRWNSHVVAVEQGLWLDPKGKDFGPNAKYFQHDLPEAKKLLAAAGYASGIKDVPASQVAGAELPTAKHSEVVNGFISELGITSKVNLIDYVKEYQGKYRNGKGQWEGWLYGTDQGGGAGDVVSGLANNYWSKGATAAYRGFSASGKNDQAGDPALDALIERARVERDAQKLRSVVYDIQRFLAKAMYIIQPPGAATGFTMAWPCLANFRVVRRDSQYTVDHLWIDDTKAPLKS